MRTAALLVFLLGVPSRAAFGASVPPSACSAAGTIDTTLAGVPAILRLPKTIRRPPILLWHGFGPPNSERALMDALPLDDVPAVKVYLGLPLFGSRAPVGGVEELVRRQKEDFASLVFEPVVIGAAEELPRVLAALEQQGCMKRGDEISLFGFSAGGATALFALAERKVPVSSVVVLNASTGLRASVSAYERATKLPYRWTDSARRLETRSDAAGRAKEIAAGDPPPALLIIQGTDDAMITSDHAVALHRALLSAYGARHERRLQLTLQRGMAHRWTDAGTVEAVRQSVAAWFNRGSAG